VLHVIEAGLRSTIQDDPRRGYARLGVPAGGPADPFAFAAARALVGERDAAVIEVVGLPFTFRCDDRRLIAVTGRDVSLRTSVRVPGWMAVAVRPGETVTVLGRCTYAYVAIEGGIALEPVLGSRATYLPAAIGPLARALASGDALPLGAARNGAARAGSRLPTPVYEGAIPVIAGPHTDRLPTALAALLAAAWSAAEGSDRMGLRLEGPALAWDGSDLLTCGVLPGAVQLPRGGAPIVLGPDAQTTGGYPVIAVVPTAALGRVAQALPGERLRFTLVTAERAADELRVGVARLAAAGPRVDGAFALS